MKILKSIFLVTITILMISCDPDDNTGGQNNNNGNKSKKLIAIKSTNAPSNNSCNVWDLLKAGSEIFPNFTVTNTSTVVDDVNTEYLGQATMTYQSSAYDKVNKKYAVSTSERVVIYDVETNSIDNIVNNMNAKAMEFVDGQLYIVKEDSIRKMSLDGTLSPVLASFFAGDKISNMTFNGNTIYFTQAGSLIKFNTVTESVTAETITLTEDIRYAGLEYKDGKIYATKRYMEDIMEDDFVEINPTTGEETILFSLEDSYTKDYSRISSALDSETGIYYLVSSNGHNTYQHTMTLIDLSVLVPTPSSSTTANNGYVFGLQLID